MNSDAWAKAEKIIDDLFMMLDETCINKKINQPVEEAALNYTIVYPEAVNHHLFNDVTGDFVMRLFNSCHFIKLESKAASVAEAVSILKMGYQGSGSSHGYDAAFVDAMNPEINGLEHVFQQIKEIVISILRGRYIQWVYDTVITPLEWSTRVAVAEILLNQCRPCLPSNMQSISPGQMADDIPVLIKAVQASEDEARSLTSGINVP